jgi:hypothetical protein
MRTVLAREQKATAMLKCRSDPEFKKATVACELPIFTSI